MNKIYVGGTFDLFHYGHVRLLETCSKMGLVYVALNTDEFVLKYKGALPVCSFAERREVLKACRYVNCVIENSGGADSKPAIRRVMPNMIVMGSDWVKSYKKQLKVTDKWLSEYKIQMVFLPYTQGISSTSIKERMK